jgi:endonuclease YncB( thermonuclease family)
MVKQPINKRKLILLLASFLTIAISYAFTSRTESFDFTVVDGDTLKKGDAYYRATYIDTPELHGGQKDKVLAMLANSSCLYSYAKIARDYLEKQQIEVSYSITNKDKYGRQLADFKSNGTDISMTMVSLGYAMCYYREPIIWLPKTYDCLKIEEKARIDKLGIWECN